MRMNNLDMMKNARRYAQEYALNTSTGVKQLLRDQHRISARRGRGDMSASDILIDLNTAIQIAGLTNRQREAVAWIYENDATQQAAAEMMGIRKDSVKDLVAAGVERITAIFVQWNYAHVIVEYEGEEHS
ncbi:RNA polymerase subunit sigma [Paenibacillus sp. 1011MAR3C5]|nr:RNA polymerase subunit sigma [Paenibacillus sp. 1011MAR3C5]